MSAKKTEKGSKTATTSRKRRKEVEDAFAILGTNQRQPGKIGEELCEEIVWKHVAKIQDERMREDAAFDFGEIVSGLVTLQSVKVVPADGDELHRFTLACAERLGQGMGDIPVDPEKRRAYAVRYRPAEWRRIERHFADREAETRFFRELDRLVRAFVHASAFAAIAPGGEVSRHARSVTDVTLSALPLPREILPAFCRQWVRDSSALKKFLGAIMRHWIEFYRPQGTARRAIVIAQNAAGDEKIGWKPAKHRELLVKVGALPPYKTDPKKPPSAEKLREKLHRTRQRETVKKHIRDLRAPRKDRAKSGT